jgi:hypothetical protein
MQNFNDRYGIPSVDHFVLTFSYLAYSSSAKSTGFTVIMIRRYKIFSRKYLFECFSYAFVNFRSCITWAFSSYAKTNYEINIAFPYQLKIIKLLSS